MTDSKPGFDLAGLQAELGSASAALNEFAQGPARRAAEEVGASFDRAGARIAQTLARAALSGEVSFKRLAKVVLEELARLALSQVFGKGGLPFFGAKAGGGAVNAGGAYLVGERGPEMFVPRQSGAVAPDAASIARHQGQIAAQIARAVAYGRRNL